MAVLRLAEHARGRWRGAASRVASWLIWSLPEPLRGYLLGVEALAVAAIVVALMAVAWRPSQLLIFIGLLVCGIVAIEATRGVQEVHGTVARDLQSVWYLAMAITLPPGYALLAPIPMAAYRLLRVRQRHGLQAGVQQRHAQPGLRRGVRGVPHDPGQRDRAPARHRCHRPDLDRHRCRLRAHRMDCQPQPAARRHPARGPGSALPRPVRQPRVDHRRPAGDQPGRLPHAGRRDQPDR